MAQASRTEIFNTDINNVYETIIDYASYPDYVDGVSEVEILEQDENGARVEYSLNFIKKFKYILSLKHTKPNLVSWSFESGAIFKKNTGSWELKDLGDGRTEVKYNLEVEIKGFAPKKMVDSLAAKNLPKMLEQYKQRAERR